MNHTPRAPTSPRFFPSPDAPHFAVHGRREQNRRAGGECDRGQRMTGEAVRELRDDVRGRGRDEEQIRAVGERNVTGMPALFFVVETGRDRIFRERLQGKRRDKFRRVLRHHDKDIMSLLDQQAGEFGRFVSGDRAGHPEDDGSFLLLHR